MPGLLQHPTPTQLRGIDVADPIRETRCRPTGRSIREAFTIPGKPKDRRRKDTSIRHPRPQTTPRRPSLARHARRRNPHHPNAFRSSGKCLLTNREAPQSLALDAAGDVYVVDFAGGSHTVPGRVVKLAAGSNTQTVLSFAGLDHPDEGVAVDTAGNVYVTDFGNDRVLKLAAGTSGQTVLPFTGIRDPDGVAVDTDGNVYVTDAGQQPGAEVGGRVEHPDGAAVPRPPRPRRCGGGHCGQSLRRRPEQASGAEVGGRVGHPDGAAVHRPQTPRRVWRWTPPATSTSPTRSPNAWWSCRRDDVPTDHGCVTTNDDHNGPDITIECANHG